MSAATTSANRMPGQVDLSVPRFAAAQTPQPETIMIRPAAVKPHPSDSVRRDGLFTFSQDTGTDRRGGSECTNGSSAVGSRRAGGTGTEARPYRGFGSVGSPHGSAGGDMRH